MDKRKDMRNLHGRVLSMLVASCVACAPDEVATPDAALADVERATEALWMDPGSSLWPTGTIPVCLQPYYNGHMPGSVEWAEGAELVRTSVESAFENVPEARIDFTGWGLCEGWSDFKLPATPTGTLHLMVNTGDGAHNAIFRQCPPGDEFGAGSDELQSCTAPHAGYSSTLEPVVYWGRYHGCPITALLHEVGHALGFAHELDRMHDEGCGAPGSATQGDFFTHYDPESILSGTYCTCNGQLSAGDRLGLSIAYPTDFSRTVQGRHSFSTGSGLLVRDDDSLITEWTQRGAPSTVFDSPIDWTIGIVHYSTPIEFPVNGLPRVFPVSGHYDDLKGRRHTLEPTTVRVDNSMHAAVLLAAL
jgi:hypothetical protein